MDAVQKGDISSRRTYLILFMDNATRCHIVIICGEEESITCHKL